MARNSQGHDIYASPLWKKVREGILMRDAYLCQRCGRLATEVHHKIHVTPETIGNAELMYGADNLVSLCHACHMAEHTYDIRGRGGGSASEYEYTFNADGQLVRK